MPKNEKREKKQRPKVVGVSPQAHEKMYQEAFVKSKPRMNFREYINVINGLPKEL